MSASGERYRVGYALEPKKVKTFMLPSLVEHAGQRGVDLVPVDPTAPLIPQGPFHCLIHKLNASDWTHQLLKFSADFPQTPVVDPPDRIERLHSRLSMLEAVAGIQISERARRFRLGVPKQRLMADPGEELGLNFPVIAKPLQADGAAGSHEMVLVFDAQGLRSLEAQTPLVIQEFVNHGGVVFKVYVLGSHVECVKRPSLADICVSGVPDGGVLPFSRISNSTTAVEEDEKGDGIGDDLADLVKEVASGLKEQLGLRLFNFDLIRSSSDPNSLFIIDINYFPGYAKIPNYERLFTDFLLQLIRNN